MFLFLGMNSILKQSRYDSESKAEQEKRESNGLQQTSEDLLKRSKSDASDDASKSDPKLALARGTSMRRSTINLKEKRSSSDNSFDKKRSSVRKF
jgi:hypothetical protein